MKTKQALKLMIVVLVLLVVGLKVESDDKELFMGSAGATTIVKPNVMILMDNSGSMNTIIFYPKNGPDGEAGTTDDGYNPNTTYSGTVDGLSDDTMYLTETLWYGRWKTSSTTAKKYSTSGLTNTLGDGKNFWTGCYAGSGTDFQCGSNSEWFYVGDKVIFCDTASPYNDAKATIAAKYTDGSGNPWFTLSNIEGGPITVNAGHFQKCPTGKTWTPELVNLYATSDHSQQVRYPKNYINWLFFTATDTMRTLVSHFSTYGTFDVTKTPGAEISNCQTSGSTRYKQVFTRIQTAREVVCKVTEDSNSTVKLGLYNFDYDNGGTLMKGLENMADESSGLVAYKNKVWDIAATSWTPLAETMADIWFYYKPGPTSKTYWPVDYEIANGTVNHSTTNSTDPVDYWCQNNYVVIMTDGESTKDGFNDSTKYGASIFKNRPVKNNTTLPYGTGYWTTNGWGDPDNNDASSGIPTNYKITGTYCPNYTCWLRLNDGGGTDYLDDVAYFLRHQDMFPDSFWGTDTATGWPGDQNIYTYVIGFTADNNMLQQTAINGDGAYYTANNFEELVNAFQLVITSINLRNYAFSSITAPKKSTTATNDELTYSYVGYFMPSSATSLWEGHLLAFKLLDLWGFDEDENDAVGPEEFVYSTEAQCASASNGKTCERWVFLDIGHEWDAADKMPSTRSLYTSISTNIATNIAFDTSNIGVLKHLMGLTTTDDATKTEQATQIIEKITLPKLADIFHSDVSFVGAPPAGKQYLPNIDANSDETYATFYANHKERTKVIYAGTNDGVMHMFYAGGVNAGKEVWGYIPDEVLPSMNKIVLDNVHTYTVDGRITPEDVSFEKAGAHTWSTILCFGLRSGGNAYYALDISDVNTTPKVLWKFKNEDWSGKSWGEPIVTRIMMKDPDNSSKIIQKWVVFLTGGFNFDSENPYDKKGKAIFMVDAGTGNLLWMLGYDSTIAYSGTEPEAGILPTVESGTTMLLTKADEFNFSIPSAMIAVDKDSNGLVDTLYFGNKAGHLFKTDISNSDPMQWKTSILFKTAIVNKASNTISTSTLIASDKYDLLLASNATSAGFEIGDDVIGNTSYATGYIVDLDQKTITVNVTSGTFQANETVVSRTYNPIYLSPSAIYDKCYTPWVCFGTGDRDRPRTNKNQGSYVIFKDNGTLLQQIDNEVTTGVDETAGLQDVSSIWTAGTDPDTMAMAKTTLDPDKNGWYFNFPETGEKLFDPEPVVLPDKNFNPCIYLNSYQPPVTVTKNLANPCDVPSEGTMTLYELKIGCGVGVDIAGSNRLGRIAGGGIYSGKEYIMYEGTDGQVASVPGGDSGEDSNLGTHSMTLEYPGGVVFWLEKKK